MTVTIHRIWYGLLMIWACRFHLTKAEEFLAKGMIWPSAIMVACGAFLLAWGVIEVISWGIGATRDRIWEGWFDRE
jgi:hypothetical protein